jgi:hypothetical protein
MRSLITAHTAIRAETNTNAQNRVPSRSQIEAQILTDISSFFSGAIVPAELTTRRFARNRTRDASRAAPPTGPL